MSHSSLNEKPFVPNRECESVEMVVRAEHAFQIEIENAEAEKVETPGQFIDLIYSKVGAGKTGVCPTQHIFYKLRGLLVAKFNLKKSEIELDTDIRAFCETKDQLALWNFLQEHFSSLRGTNPVRPPLLNYGLFLLIIGSCLALYFLQEWTLSYVFLAGFFIWWFVLELTKPFRTRIPENGSTPRRLASHIVSVEAKEQMPEQVGWSRGQIADVVKSIVLEVLAPSKYWEEAYFVDDLGLVD